MRGCATLMGASEVTSQIRGVEVRASATSHRFRGVEVRNSVTLMETSEVTSQI